MSMDPTRCFSTTIDYFYDRSSEFRGLALLIDLIIIVVYLVKQKVIILSSTNSLG